MDTEDLMSFFGMTEAKAKETAKNVTLSKYLQDAVKEYNGLSKVNPPSKKISNLIYAVASKMKPSTLKYLPLIVKYIVEEKLDSEARVTAALKYLLESLKDSVLNVGKFEEACGIGITVSDEEIERAVKIAVDHHKSEIIEKRYRFNIGLLLGYIRNLPKMAWADGGKLKNEADMQIIVLLGPKTEEDRKPLVKAPSASTANGGGDSTKKQAKPAKPTKLDEPKEDDNLTPRERIINILKKLPFHKPGANYTTEGYPTSELALQLLTKHMKETGGQVRTRFPPEPNGILHIGHAKAININFGYALANDGVCFLRYDDTNPEKEEDRFFRSIREMVEWLGYSPAKVTHASDYFEDLYQFAKVLISKGMAFVCHQTADEMKGFNTVTSPWRDRSVDENLKLFEDMKAGKFDEGEATLRMKITLEEGKQDPVAYRVRFVPHPKAGTKWCIYPTYDFTHCLCDSLENITHSLCTKEFQNRRSSYYWLCEAVETYIPVQWEYGRLNVCYTVVSKRKIAKLITEGIVADWDDPRLFTLPALRRRGFPAIAVNDFCVKMGVTGATIIIDPAMLEACVRDVLNVNAPRTMVVLEPLKVTIENFPFPEDYSVDVPDFPSVSDSKCHKVALNRIIYIERSDFREKTDKSYKRFASDQSVGLRHAGLVLTVKKIIAGDNGDIKEIVATCSKVGEPSTTKPKGFIHWVSNPLSIEVRLYDRLFNHKNPEDPEEVPGGFISDCNRDSLHKLEAYADKHIIGAKMYSQYQFERMGFFSVDPDTTSAKLIFNRTVTLKEDNEKS